ncbi:hypothetical protein P8452_14712 [Trifolium repens]|nr:hypothetical protein P8452_14712 [Trifolium repens]
MSCNIIALLVVLLFCLGNASTNVTLEDNQSLDGAGSTIYINTIIPAVHYNCGPHGTYEGNPGSTVDLHVDFDYDTVCHASWRNLYGAFLARDVVYDQHNLFVYWLVKSDGFYHSWDNYTWIKRDEWV